MLLANVAIPATLKLPIPAFPDTSKSPSISTFPLNVGDAEKTAFPVPVSSVNTDLRLAELGVPKNVATFDANPDTPELIGSPVASARLKAGVASEAPSARLTPP